MGILILAAHKNAIITVSVNGDDSASVMQGLEEMFAKHFEEKRLEQ